MRIEITHEHLRADLALIKAAQTEPSKEVRLAVTVVSAGANQDRLSSNAHEDVETKTAVFNVPKAEKKRQQLSAPSMPKL